MKFHFKKTLFKTAKVVGITLASIVLLMFLLPVLFPKTITKQIKQLANNSINGEINFSGASLSFFKRFPELTLTLDNFLLKGSAPFQNDTLVAANDVSFTIDLSSLLKSKINISKIYLSNANINIEVDSLGHPNYNVYKSQPQQKTNADTSAASLGIEAIIIQKSKLTYADASVPMLLKARDVDYTGSGDFTKDIFDLSSHLQSSSVDFSYNHVAYAVNKKVNAQLVTSINTQSLAFTFQKNNLMINQLPVNFIGRFGFLKDGYDMDFRFNSFNSDLGDVLTVVPPAYAKWVENTDADGTGIIHLAITGKYIASKKMMPALDFSMKVRNGVISNNKTPGPIKNLYVDMEARVPNMDPDSLQLHIDSLHFNIDNDYFNARFRVNGLKTPDIFASVNTEIDLAKWVRALGQKSIDLKGRYALHLLAQGKYATGRKKVGLRKYETVITSVPKFSLKSSFTNGYIKYAELPEPIKNISFNLDAQCPDHDPSHFTMSLDQLNAEALGNFIRGYFKMSNTNGLLMDGDVQAKFRFDDLRQFYPAGNDMDIRGNLVADLKTKGRYIPSKKVYPVTRATIDLQNGYIKTKYYPDAIQNLQISTNIVNTTGTINGTKVIIKPLSLQFEGQPFVLKANLQNFSNLNYSVYSNGTLDIGKIYKVFAVKGYDVSGIVITNFSLKGKQSDALAGHYDKLSNTGTIKVQNLVVTSELFPKPFFIKSGLFSFHQDKMNFDAFTASYGKSVMVLDGSLSNVIDYAVRPGAVLNGSFTLKSDLIIADDFMAFASPSPTTVKKPANAAQGVILVPQNLNLNFTASVKEVKYNGLDLTDVKGQMTIDSGKIGLRQTGFTIIGAPVTMDADYGSITPMKAYFDYHINAQNFDIKRAYNEIKLFHDMATSASSAEGIVSLDYKLAGKLNSSMSPVYPSLKGGGVLSLQKIKIKGFKLFSAVGKETGHDSLAKPSDVSKVDIKTTIANNIITIERTKMRVAGFRPRFEGQVSLTGDLNLQFRLGLPPFGIFGIPMTITGTQANPIIHTGKAKKDDELKEAADDSQ
jgi:AsmA protein